MAQSNTSSIVTKVAETLDIVTKAQRPLSFSEIVQRTGFVKSSTHRILSVMLGENLLEYDEATKTYRLGSRLLHWAQTAWRRTDLQEVAERELATFSEMHTLNIGLSILDNDEVLYLRTMDAIPVRYATRAGERAPLHCTAVGKVFLAYLSEKKRAESLSRLNLERITENSIQKKARMELELDRVRKRGYGTSNREEALQVVGIAAPIFDSAGGVMAGISAWTTTAYSDMAKLEQRAPDLLAMTLRISKLMGHDTATGEVDR